MIREADIEIVDRKNSVLLLAGGPMPRVPVRAHACCTATAPRRSTCCCKRAQPGMSQEANKILDDFPATREAMSLYDCVVAFDPDWQALSRGRGGRAGQLGGRPGRRADRRGRGGVCRQGDRQLAARPGDGQDPQPLSRGVPAAACAGVDNAYTSKEPWPLNFTREGLEADFLWLGDAADGQPAGLGSVSRRVQFLPCARPEAGRHGAGPLLRSPRRARSGRQPVYFAGQFYGSGRVFYMGSGEMWRLRRLDGTISSSSTPSSSATCPRAGCCAAQPRRAAAGQDRYMLGNTVEVRAQLTNARLEPLAAKSVVLEVIPPGGPCRWSRWPPIPRRAGNFAGQFQVLERGHLSPRIARPRKPRRTPHPPHAGQSAGTGTENPQLNDVLLSRIAEQTGGQVFRGHARHAGSGGKKKSPPLVKLLEDRTNVVTQHRRPRSPLGARPGCGG